jgi:thioredoxin reductase (NADPH)
MSKQNTPNAVGLLAKGLTIDFSGDTSVAAPAAPAPLPDIAIDVSGDTSVATATGGPGFVSAAEGRTESKLIIVGSGPAGLTAAIYAARANLEPIVLAGSTPGGQLMLTSDVENYPGFPDGIQGPDLMALFRAQAERFGTHVVDVDIDRVDLSQRPFRLWARGVEYRAQSLIVATGASAMWLGLDSETRLRGRGVSACATCDGFFFRDKEIAVVGGGDTAFEEASYLTRFASKVHMLHRRDEFRASRIMVERARSNPKIEIHTNTGVEEVLGDEKVTGLRLVDTETGAEREMRTDGLFIAIGHRPNTEAFRDWLEVDAKGYLVVRDKTNSEIEGVFIAGDVHDHRYRQAVSAAGDGCMAAIDAERWLESQGITEANTLTAW